jgi:hypothetical protein
MFTLLYLLCDLHYLLERELGHTGMRRCTGLRAVAGRRNILITFELGSERPIRLGLYRHITHTFDDFRMTDWLDLTDDSVVWTLTEDIFPRFANSPDDLAWHCPTCGADEVSANGSLACTDCAEPDERIANSPDDLYADLYR